MDIPRDITALSVTVNTVRSAYVGRRVRFVGKPHGEGWPEYGAIGRIIEVDFLRGYAAPFIISWPKVTFHVQPLLKDIEFV